MSQATTSTNRYLIWIFIFICGFVTGVAVTVYKLQPQLNSKSAPVTAAAPQQGVDHERMHSLEDIVAKNPEDSAAWTELSHLYFDSNQHKKAIKAYNQSLKLTPNDPNLWTDLGVMYRRDGQPQKAVECFDKAIAIAPMHQPSRFNKGIVALYDLGDTDAAIASFEDLLTINPDAKANSGQSVAEFIQMLKKEQQKAEK